MRDRNGRASGAGFRRSEGSDGSGAETLPPAWIGGPVGGSGTVVRRPAGVGDYRWIGDEAAFETLLDELASCEVYGLDTEFHRERTYFPHLALLQLSWEGGIALVDPLAIDISSFARVLDGPGLAVLHAAEQDLEVLERACGTVPSRLFDTQVAAGFLGQVSPSLVKLVERTLGVRLLKGDQLTDWTRRPLSAGQLAYAAGDVAHLLALRDSIGARLEEMGRSAWAEEEFAIVLSRDRSPTEPSEAWWRLPRSRQLRGPARGVAQAVAAWRDRRARQLDLPVRFILPDLALLSIAQHPARTREDLRRTRSLDGRHLGGGAADELLEAIAEGLELAPAQLALPPAHELDQPNRAVTTLATAYVAQRAADLDLDPAILATRADLVEFMQDPPRGRLAEGWRSDLVGEGLRRLSDGKASLSFDGHGALVLEERSFRSFDHEARSVDHETSR
ncbi:MAG: ribonuclease D [Acidimicrobiales bacterium]|jgi:ribonuclease D